MKAVLVVGAGMGGLTAALRLARRNVQVQVIEARAGAGGLASSFEAGGFSFDCGPYILLDRPGLEWAFQAVGLDLEQLVELRRIERIYEVCVQGTTIEFLAGAEETAAGLDRTWPGSGAAYIRYVESMGALHQRLQPTLLKSRPGPGDLIRIGAWREALFLLRTLGSVLSSVPLPQPVKEAIAIWTHVAGQPVDEAPSPMAFVPWLFHHVGCFYPTQGMGTIPQALARSATDAGVRFRFGVKARGIRCGNGVVRGVETEEGEFIAADAVISNHGLGTYLGLVDDVPRRARQSLGKLPLQSPGVCAYLAMKGNPQRPYLRFQLPEQEQCRLLLTPAALDPKSIRDGWYPARLLGPMRHADAESLGKDGQHEYLARLLGETWWRQDAEDFRVLATRVPAEWGSQFHLYRDSMNPVMTPRFMRAGRLAHRSPFVRGLYLAGSSTHPGQWVSFCAISGVLAANCLLEDLAKC